MKKRFFTGSFMYTGDPGIRCFELDTETGKLTAGEINQDVWNPTYLCINKTRDRLYATSEHDVGEGVPSGVNAFAINADGSLTHLGFAEASGFGATHVAVSGKYLAIAEYYTGDVDLYALDENGGIACLIANDRHEGKGPVEVRQDCAHAHYVGFDPFDPNKLWAVDLGNDTVYVYDAAGGRLAVERTIPFPAGEGPRHLLFSKKRPDLVYCVCEITFNVMTLEKATGKILSTVSAIDDGFEGWGGAAAIRFGKDEEYLYVSNRVLDPPSGMDSVACFRLDEKGIPQKPEIIKTGYRFPRDMNVFAEYGLMAVAYQFDDKLQIRRIGKNGVPGEAISEISVESACCITDLI